MKSLSLLTASAGVVFLTFGADPAWGKTKTVVVAPGIPGGWESPAGGTYRFDAGTVPMGKGALVLSVADGQAQSGFTTGVSPAAVRLKDLKSLKYTIQRTEPSTGTGAPVIELDIDFDLKDGNTAPQGKLVYDPALNGTVTTGTWQTWNAFGGKWYFEGSAIAANAEAGQPFAQSAPATLKQILTQFPNAGVRAGSGTLSLKAGSEAGAFTAAVDSLTVTFKGGGTTWNFEPDSDGDLVPDLNDRAPLSDLRLQVDMGFGPTSLTNSVDKNGESIQDKILKALATSKNPNKYLKAIDKLAKDLQKTGAITPAQNAEMRSTAGYFVYAVTGGSSIPVSAGGTLSGTGVVINNGLLNLNSGGLTKTGMGGVTLAGVDTSTGGLGVSGGILQLDGGGGAGLQIAGNNVAIDGGWREFGPGNGALIIRDDNLIPPNLVPIDNGVVIEFVRAGGDANAAINFAAEVNQGAHLNLRDRELNAGARFIGIDNPGGFVDAQINLIRRTPVPVLDAGLAFQGGLLIVGNGNEFQLIGNMPGEAGLFEGAVVDVAQPVNGFVRANEGLQFNAGNLVLNAGNVVLTPARQAVGTLFVTEGTLVIDLSANNSLTVDSNVNIGAGGTLVVRGSWPVTFTGTITNNGTVRVERGATLDASGATGFVNNGTIDAISGTLLPPATLTYGPAGSLLDAGTVQVRTAVHEGSTFTLTVDGYAGHTYQLQRATNLEEGFTNTGAPQTGAGAVLTFTSDEATGERGFYRVAVDP